MNFLAHIYLSGDNDFVKIGNFMADGIRGKEFENYPDDVRKGIMLHRAIDTFTDAHPVFRQGTKRLHAQFHHFAGVVMDVFYDHFLAKNWAVYSNKNLEDFALDFYNSLDANYEILSDKTKNLLPFMKQYNWLASYATIDGISRILIQMDSRTGNKSQMRFAPVALREHYALFEEEFAIFFAEVQIMASKKLSEL